MQDELGDDANSQRFASEFVAAVNRINYNQGNQLNALAGVAVGLFAVQLFPYHCSCAARSGPHRRTRLSWWRRRSGVDAAGGGQPVLCDPRRQCAAAEAAAGAQRRTAARLLDGRQDHAPPAAAAWSCTPTRPSTPRSRASTRNGTRCARSGPEGRDGHYGTAHGDAEEHALGCRCHDTIPWPSGMCGAQEVAGPFDAVIIAAPLEQSSLEFKGLHVGRLPERAYQPVVTTYVTGLLRPSYFNLQQLPSGASRVVAVRCLAARGHAPALNRWLLCARCMHRCSTSLQRSSLGFKGSRFESQAP